MRRTKTIASVLLATIAALCSFAAANAAAELPELGRCVKAEGVVEGKKTVYSGAYASKTCTRLSPTGKGRYEFLPGPGPANHFYAVGEETVLETVGGTKIECVDMAIEGEYTGPKTEKASKVHFDACSTGTETVRACQTNPDKKAKGIIEGTGFEGQLGVIAAGAKPTVGWDLKHEGEGPAFVFECGELPQPVTLETIEGSVISTVTRQFLGSNLNKMSEFSGQRYRASKGLQQPEMFEGGAKDVLMATTVNGLTTTTEQMGLTSKLEVSSGPGKFNDPPESHEPSEIKTITR